MSLNINPLGLSKIPGFLDNISLGNIPNAEVEYIPFFGKAASSDNVFKTVWPAGDFQKTIPTVASFIELTSTDASDVGQSVVFQGILADGTSNIELLTLNGQTPVSTSQEYKSVFQLINRGPSLLSGNVYASPTGSLKTLGTPDNQSDIRAYMDFERNRTSSGFYRVPSNKRAVLKAFNATSGDGADLQVRITANLEGNPPVTLYEPLLRNGTSNTGIQLGFVLEPGVLFQVQAKGGTQKPDISGFCELYLIDL